MSRLSRLRSLWRNLSHRDRLERDLDDELRATFEGLVDEHVAAGMDPARARRAATLALGRVDSIKTQVRDARAGHGVETVWHDVRFGARMLRRSPLFTLAAVLSLGIGIGANTTIFSVVNAVLLRDLRVRNPRALVELWRTTQFGSGTAFSYPAYEQLRDENQVFEGVIALSKSTVAGHAGETAAPLSGRYVSGNFFEVLGLTPLAGRLISARDDRADAPEGAAIAVVSQRISERAFGGSAGTLGTTIRVDAVSFTVVGVLPPAFDDAVVGRPADFFIPMASEPLIRRDSRLRSAPSNWLGILGRLKPDVTSERAAANLAPIFARFMAEVAAPMPDAEARQRLQAQRLFLQPGSGGTSDVRRDVSRPLWLLMGAVSLVLLIACANVINLLLARGVARRREIGVRLAIGASRQRLVRQLLTESALLGIAGAALGMAIAFVGAPLIVWLVSEGGSRMDVNVTPDGRILLFTVTLAVASSLAAGVLPALRTARSDITPSFAGGARSLAVTPESARWGKALIAAQVALSLLLVIGAALLAETLRRIRAVDPGFEAGHVMLFTLDPTRVGYSAERLTQYYRDVLDTTRTVAGVQAASVSKITPISGGGIDLPITIAGRRREPGLMVYVNRISEGFFATMAVPLLLGRDLVPQDGNPGNAVAIVNEALAQRYFGGENPIGRRITLGNQNAVEIVGLAANSKYYSLREAVRPTVYIYGLNTGDPGGLTLSVRTSGHPLALANQIREQVQSIAATVPVSEGRSLSSQVERSLGTERLVARLLGAFAAVALLLAAVGLYGVLGYHVVRRTGEIGLRLALGASRRAVLGSVLRQSMTVVAIGSAIGIPASMMLSRPLGGLLYDVTPSDPAVLSGAVACLFLVALAAAAVPAWRAASVDPLVALRHQ